MFMVVMVIVIMAVIHDCDHVHGCDDVARALLSGFPMGFRIRRYRTWWWGFG
jgi:hypothetical protein